VAIWYILGIFGASFQNFGMLYHGKSGSPVHTHIDFRLAPFFPRSWKNTQTEKRKKRSIIVDQRYLTYSNILYHKVDSQYAAAVEGVFAPKKVAASMYRVTRLGEFSPIGWLLTLYIFKLQKYTITFMGYYFLRFS
jgi:hypothetical protein